MIHHAQRGSPTVADEAFRRTYTERIGADESTVREPAVLDPTSTVLGRAVGWAGSSASARRAPAAATPAETSLAAWKPWKKAELAALWSAEASSG